MPRDHSIHRTNDYAQFYSEATAVWGGAIVNYASKHPIVQLRDVWRYGVGLSEADIGRYHLRFVREFLNRRGWWRRHGELLSLRRPEDLEEVRRLYHYYRAHYV